MRPQQQLIHQTATNKLAELATEFADRWNQNNPTTPLKPDDPQWLREWDYELLELADTLGIICPEFGPFAKGTITYYFQPQVCAVLQGTTFLTLTKTPPAPETATQTETQALETATQKAIQESDHLADQEITNAIPTSQDLDEYRHLAKKNADPVEYPIYSDVLSELRATYPTDEDEEVLFIPLSPHGHPIDIYLARDLEFLHDKVKQRVGILTPDGQQQVPPSPPGRPTVTTTTETIQKVIAAAKQDAYAHDPAMWVRHACLILDRITPTLYEDCHTTLSGHPKDIVPNESNNHYLGLHDQPGTAHPALRRATITNPDAPAPQSEAIAIWNRYVDDLNACQAMLPQWMQMPKPKGPRMVSWLLHRLKDTATTWETQPGTRAEDFRPVLIDCAHTLRRIVLTDLVGWTTPRTIGTTACTNAGATARCRISPVHAKGLCRPCYDQTRNGHTNDAN